MKSKLSSFILPLIWLYCGGCKKVATSAESDKSIEAGWRQYSFGAYDVAVDIFDNLVRQAGDEKGPKSAALYGMATVWDLRRPGENPERARKFYQLVTEQKTDGEYAAWSELALGRMQELVPVGQNPNRAATDDAYQKVIDNHPSQLAAEEAFIYQMVGRVKLYQPDVSSEAIKQLKEFISTHPSSLFLPAAHGLVAECYRVLAEPGKRLNEEIAALEMQEKLRSGGNKAKRQLSIDTSLGGIVFKIANIAEFEAGDFATARRYYQKFIAEYPLEKRNFYARQALRRMDQTEARIRSEMNTTMPL